MNFNGAASSAGGFCGMAAAIVSRACWIVATAAAYVAALSAGGVAVVSFCFTLLLVIFVVLIADAHCRVRLPVCTDVIQQDPARAVSQHRSPRAGTRAHAGRERRSEMKGDE
jgi:hypothetical protein